MNGLAQATGWSGLSRIFRSSFARDNRGVTMGWWTTNYVAGGFLATMLAAYAATGPLLRSLGWKRAVWAPAMVLLALELLFRRVFGGSESTAEAAPPRAGLAYLTGVLDSGRIRSVALAYLLMKFIRYSFLFWLPLLLTEYFGIEVRSAAYISALFDLAGIGGALFAGYLSDRVFASRRFPVVSTMLLALSGISLMPCFHARGRWMAAIEISLLGFVTYGPDTLLVGAATH